MALLIEVIVSVVYLVLAVYNIVVPTGTTGVWFVLFVSLGLSYLSALVFPYWKRVSRENVLYYPLAVLLCFLFAVVWPGGMDAGAWVLSFPVVIIAGIGLFLAIGEALGIRKRASS
jgi:hypothetical protein